MKTTELKSKLINRINKLEDDLLLEEISRLIEIENEESEIYCFTDEESKSIEEAREQYTKGEFLSNEEANKEVDEWLGK